MQIALYIVLLFRKILADLDQLDYLTSFGYLPDSIREGNLQVSSELYETGVMAMQRSFGLPETGKIDPTSLKYMKMRRCGVKYDLDGDRKLNVRMKRGIDVYRITQRPITYRVVNGAHSLYYGTVRRVLREVFDFYDRNAGLAFRETSDPDALMQISFEKEVQHGTCPYRFENRGVLAHAFQPLNPIFKIGSDLHFNDVHQWSSNYRSSYENPSFYAVAVHEIGHALGLDHNPNNRSVMFAVDIPRPKKEEINLDSNDLYVLNYLYGRKNSDRIPHPAAPKPQPTERPSGPPTEPPTYGPPHEDPIKPRPCTSSVDAIFTIDDEIFLFKADWYWRVYNNTRTIEGPLLVSERFMGLPTPIDAAINFGNNTYFFVDDKYYIYQYPHKYQLYGASRIKEHLKNGPIEKVDLAFHLPDPTFHDADHQTFLWTKGRHGNEYWWLFDPHQNGVLAVIDGPMSRSGTWGKIPQDSNAAFSLHNDVYFVRGNQVYKMKTLNPSSGIADALDFSPRRVMQRHQDRHRAQHEGSEPRPLEESPHKDTVFQVAFDQHGHRLATCSSDMTVAIWDRSKNGDWIRSAFWKEHGGPVWRVCWAASEFGQVIATSSKDRSVHIWEELMDLEEYGVRPRYSSAGWVRRARLTDSRADVVDIKFAPRHLGLQLAAASVQGKVRIHEARDLMDLSQWTLIHTLQPFARIGLRCSSVAWSSARCFRPLIACASDEEIPEEEAENKTKEPKPEERIKELQEQRVRLYEYIDTVSGGKWFPVQIKIPVALPVNDMAFSPCASADHHTLAVAAQDVHVLNIQIPEAAFLVDDSPQGTETLNSYATIRASFNSDLFKIWRLNWDLTGTVLTGISSNGTLRYWISSHGNRFVPLRALQLRDYLDFPKLDAREESKDERKGKSKRDG